MQMLPLNRSTASYITVCFWPGRPPPKDDFRDAPYLRIPELEGEERNRRRDISYLRHFLAS